MTAKKKDEPIHLAARQGALETVKKLLAKKKSLLNAKGVNGFTPLMRAADDAKSIPLVKFLLEAGADVHIKNAAKNTVLGCIASDRQTPVEIVRLLLDYGSDPNETGEGYPTFIFAATYGNKEVVELMMERGCRIDMVDREDRTPMDAAIHGKNHEVIKFLLSKGADPESRDKSGFGKTLLEYAADSGDQELIRSVWAALAAKGAPKNPYETFGTLTLAAKKGDTATVKTLVESGIPVDSANWEGETGLMLSAAYGRLTVLQYLLSKGANVMARDRNGSTALHYAAAEGQVEAIGILIQAGADVADTNDFNWTALMQSAHKGFFAGVEALIAAKSPLDTVDREWGFTALTLAKFAKGEKAIELLEKAGAKERAIRVRRSDEPVFSPLDCDICAYLPHAKELEHAYEPREFPGLETAHEKREGNQHVADYDMVKRCVNCGTHYYHHYYFDDEDSLGGAGPSCNQFFARFNLQMLKNYFGAQKLDAEFKEFAQRYPALMDEFSAAWASGRDMLPYIRVYVLDSLMDEYILNKDWQALKEFFFEHARPDFRLAALHNMLCIYALEGDLPWYPSHYRERNCTPEVRTKVKKLMQNHREEFSTYLSQTLRAAETTDAKFAAEVRAKAAKFGFISRGMDGNADE